MGVGPIRHHPSNNLIMIYVHIIDYYFYILLSITVIIVGFLVLCLWERVVKIANLPYKRFKEENFHSCLLTVTVNACCELFKAAL